VLERGRRGEEKKSRGYGNRNKDRLSYLNANCSCANAGVKGGTTKDRGKKKIQPGPFS